MPAEQPQSQQNNSSNQDIVDMFLLLFSMRQGASTAGGPTAPANRPRPSTYIGQPHLQPPNMPPKAMRPTIPERPNPGVPGESIANPRASLIPGADPLHPEHPVRPPRRKARTTMPEENTEFATPAPHFVRAPAVSGKNTYEQYCENAEKLRNGQETELLTVFEAMEKGANIREATSAAKFNAGAPPAAASMPRALSTGSHGRVLRGSLDETGEEIIAIF